jgi:hypothetical protein
MKKFSLIILMLLVVIIAGIILAVANEKTHSWPAIRPIEKTFHFVDHRYMVGKLQIVGQNGAPLYLLECFLNAYGHEDRDFDYSGDFECRLTSLYSKETYSTLLTEDKEQTRDWQSRGRFFVEDLVGSCAEYPEYGRIRHFRLRNMSITIEIKDFQIELGSSATNIPWNRDRIKELDLIVTVASDMTATTEIAEPTKYIEPPRLHPENITDPTKKCDDVLSK